MLLLLKDCATGFCISEALSIGYVKKNTSELNWPKPTTLEGSNVWKRAPSTVRLPVSYLLSLAEGIQEERHRAIRGFDWLKCAGVHLRGDGMVAAVMMQRRHYSGVLPVSASTSLAPDSCPCSGGLSARDTCLLPYLQVVPTLQLPSRCPSLPPGCAYRIQITRRHGFY